VEPLGFPKGDDVQKVPVAGELCGSGRNPEIVRQGHSRDHRTSRQSEEWPHRQESTKSAGVRRRTIRTGRPTKVEWGFCRVGYSRR
jgi:hypothetical protein